MKPLLKITLISLLSFISCKKKISMAMPADNNTTTLQPDTLIFETESKEKQKIHIQTQTLETPAHSVSENWIQIQTPSRNTISVGVSPNTAATQRNQLCLYKR